MKRGIYGYLSLFALASSLALGAASLQQKSGIDKVNFDDSQRPQDDLFRYANGIWLKKTEIPAERALYGSFIQLADKSEADLRAIIEEVAARKNNPDGSEQQKIGDLFASFMNESRVETLGVQPVEPALASIDAISSKSDLIKALAAFQRDGVGGLFIPFVNLDAKQSDKYIVYLNQSGLGMPDESYYREESFKDIRSAYVTHIGKIFELAGIADAKNAAESAMGVETTLAKGHWDRVRSRDSTLTYNKKDRKELDILTPGFDWPLWLEAAGIKGIDELVVRQPSYFRAMALALDEVSLDRWKLWLKWKTLQAFSPFLSRPFAEEYFGFFGRTLTGAQEDRPRWKRGVAAVETALGEAVGKVYVEKHFPPAAKERMKVLVENLIAAYREDIESLPWMSAETRKKAIEKLSKFTPKIGYPDKWRDYSKLEIQRDDLVGNMRRAFAFEIDRNIAKLGNPIDKTEWRMTPQTINAYYNPGMNEIVFPAAILQPPFFDMSADDAVNYGGIGAVIGHEIGHGFDDQGSKYDGDGNMKNWWTDADRAEFNNLAKKLIEQYNGFGPAQLPGEHVNGSLTLGENIGDLGGLSIALKAYRRSMTGKPAQVIEGLSGEQRFFLGWAQIWRSKYRDAELKRRLTVDSHSPTEFRCNGVVRNLPEFYEAFGVKQGDKLWLPPEQRVRIW